MAGAAGAKPLLVTVGEVNPDIVVRGVPPMQFGQAESLVASTTLTVGSSTAITACGAARMGARVRLVGVVGDDDFGDIMLRRLGERGVDVSEVRVAAGRRTGSSVILVDATDATDRQILTDLGAMTQLAVDDVHDGVLADAEHLHIGSWFLHMAANEHLGERLARARQMGLSTSVDPNDDPDRGWDSGLQRALAEVELLFCNGSEARGLSGLDDPDAAARLLLSRLAGTSARPGLPAVVLKLGADGARLYRRDGTTFVRAPEVDVVDTVGAGDSLSGAVLAALLDGAPWHRALRLGVAAGALSTTRAGGVDGQPELAAAQALSENLAVES
jgi:sugar/nucleoside kinase (ribokinase family)